jgi:DNA-binding NtrC family response regulator
MKPAFNHTKTILLIDDDEDDYMLLGKALAALSNHIALICKQETDHLLEAIHDSNPSLIFIELYLPKRSGLDLLRQIKSHPDHKNIPVVIWSTSLMLNYVMSAYREGALAFVQKPYCLTDLVDELSEILTKCETEFPQAVPAVW